MAALDPAVVAAARRERDRLLRNQGKLAFAHFHVVTTGVGTGQPAKPFEFPYSYTSQPNVLYGWAVAPDVARTGTPPVVDLPGGASGGVIEWTMAPAAAARAADGGGGTFDGAAVTVAVLADETLLAAWLSVVRYPARDRSGYNTEVRIQHSFTFVGMAVKRVLSRGAV